MHQQYIPTDRDLADKEKELVRYLLDMGKPEAYRFIPQIEEARVRSQCECGCFCMNFIENYEDERLILAEYKSNYPDGGQFCVFVFAVNEVLGGIDYWAYDKSRNYDDDSNRPLPSF